MKPLPTVILLVFYFEGMRQMRELPALELDLDIDKRKASKYPRMEDVQTSTMILKNPLNYGS